MSFNIKRHIHTSVISWCWVLGHCWVDTPHIYIFEGDWVLSKLFAPHCHDHAECSKCGNRTASLKRFSWIIFTTNELVALILFLDSQNDSEMFFTWKTFPAGQMLYNKKCAAGQTYQTKCAAGRIFWIRPVRYSVLCSKWFIFHKSQLRIFFFWLSEYWINSLIINELIHW